MNSDNAAKVQGAGPNQGDGNPIDVNITGGSGIPNPLPVTFPTPVPVDGVDAEGNVVTVPPVFVGGKDEFTGAATGLHTLAGANAYGNIFNGPLLGVWMAAARADFAGLGQVLRSQTVASIDGTISPAGLVGINVQAFPFLFNSNVCVLERTPDTFRSVKTAAAGNTNIWTTAPGKATFRLMRYMIGVTADASTAGGAVVDISLVDTIGGAFGQLHSVFIPGAAGVGGPALYTSPWVEIDNGYVSATNGALDVVLSAALATGTVFVIVCGTEE